MHHTKKIFMPKTIAKAKTDGRKNNGGARPGAGRTAKNKVEGEIKGAVTIRMYPAHVALATAKYGSVQAWIDSMTLKFNASKTTSAKPAQ